MSSAAGAIAMLLAGTSEPAIAAAQDAQAAPAPFQDPALYRYIDDADALLDAMGTSPPDYGFRFEDLDCWGWSMSDGYLVLAEPLGDDYRFYVFAPGDDQPFFVGDQYYAYGFEGRALAAVYGENGELVAWDPADQLAAGAAWLSDRGARMKRALDDREPVVAADWADSVGWFGGLVIRFDSWRHQPGWLHYRNRPHGQHHRDWRKKLGEEGARRHQRADWFDRWRRGGYRGGVPQGDGKWTTRPPGARPGPGDGKSKDDGKGGWTGRPRPVAPATPGVKPIGPRSGDGRPGRGPRPPRDGQPGQSVPPVVPQPSSGASAPTLPSTVPPPHVPSVTIVPPSPPAPPRGEGRPDRPQMRRIEGGPLVIGKDRLRGGVAPPPTTPAAVPRSQPAPLPPPVVVAPRRDPGVPPPHERASPPPPSPAAAAPVRAAPSLPPAASRPAFVPRSAPAAPRSAPAPRASSSGSARSSGKSRDR